MQIYLVGGAVRDQLLGLPVQERDWVVVGGTPETLIQQGFKPVGKDFPVFIHPQTAEEYALARTERKTSPGYKGFVFQTSEDITLDQDLYRRDLTINAMARDDQGEIIDPYGGRADLKKRLLRHVSDAFREDPVRILRVARLSARFHHMGFRVAKETMELMRCMVSEGEARYLVAERVWQELNGALTEQTPVAFFQVLIDCGAINDTFPLLVQNLEKSLDYLQRLSGHSKSAKDRFSALCFALDTKSIHDFCKHLGVPNHYRDLALLVSRGYQVIAKGPRQTAKAIAAQLKASDGSRKPERFLQILEICVVLANIKNPNITRTFWQQALSAYRGVNAQDLIKQGFEKAALGKALIQQREKNIERLIEQYH